MSHATRFVLTAAILGSIGFILGIYMGANQDFSLKPVHSHLNLIGWLSIAMYGVVYKLYPAMGGDKLVGLHYYLSTIGVVVMMVTLAMLIKGQAWVATILVLSEVAVVLGMLLFALIVWRHRNSG